MTPAEYLAGLPFDPDPFQREAIEAFEDGSSVVVTAPTGAGKTLVAQGAIQLTLERGLRAFYTAPIKALSNQKYGDFCSEHGVDRVGLLTGDNVINPGAPLVVMTTEVLRNMIYADSSALDRLGVVILDEVHFLQDRFRGSVWEEIIIHLPRDVPLVNLSATVANAEEFTAWMEQRRGSTVLIAEERRPVPLESTYLVKDLHREGGWVMLPVLDRGGRPNRQVDQLLRKGRGKRRRFVAPRRREVIEMLQHQGLLPAIYFIFSRAGCDQGAQLVASAGLGLTTPDERREIRRRAEERTAHVPTEDLTVLGYGAWLDRLEAGVAAHHAGLVPAFKETVEELFAAGLVKVVFATETLALGINMPARTVVLERLSKFTGDAHELLQPGDYTQLTGRAGRRGIDKAGTAIVLHQRDVPFDRVAGIVGRGSHPLRSSFTPGYNMAVNLVANYSRDRAEELLGASFAEFGAAERRARLSRELADVESEIQAAREAAECRRGDIWGYVAAGGADASRARQVMRHFGQGTRIGEVLTLESPDRRWVVLARGWGSNPRLLLLSESGRVRRVNSEDLPSTAAAVGALRLDEPVRSRDAGYLRATSERLRQEPPTSGNVTRRPDAASTPGSVAGCAQLDEHLEWVRRVDIGERRRRRLERRLGRASTGLVGTFGALFTLLEEWGYLDGWQVTDAGERLRSLYNELDLVLAEAIGRGIMQDLSPADLAAVTSMFTYEARRADLPDDWPNSTVAAAGEAILDVWAAVLDAEQAAKVSETRQPDHGFSATAHAWAAGADLDDLFDEDELAAGDFVRNCRQLLDLLRQLRDGFPELRSGAAAAIKSIDRGVVAVGGRW